MPTLRSLRGDAEGAGRRALNVRDSEAGDAIKGLSEELVGAIKHVEGLEERVKRLKRAIKE